MVLIFYTPLYSPFEAKRRIKTGIEKSEQDSLGSYAQLS